jgi:hypothetical protein
VEKRAVKGAEISYWERHHCKPKLGLSNNTKMFFIAAAQSIPGRQLDLGTHQRRRPDQSKLATAGLISDNP